MDVKQQQHNNNNLVVLVNIFTFNVFCIDLRVNSVEPAQKPRFAASKLGLRCLHTSLKRG